MMKTLGIVTLILVLMICINEPRLFKYAALGLACGFGLRMIVDSGKNKNDKKDEK